MPVAGPVGAGTLAVMEERDAGFLIGVYNDWSADYAYPNQADYILASALKSMDMFVKAQIKAVMDGTFAAGNLMGTLENGYVGLAYGSSVGDTVPDELKAEIEDLTAGIIAGDIATLPLAPEEVAAGDLGSEENPIAVLFVPSVDIDFMIASGDLIADSFHAATGLYFTVAVPTSYAAVIEEMCASPESTMAFIPPMGYVLANELCGVEPALAADRYGWNVYWTQFLVARDSEYQTLEDLEGATWGAPSYTSTSGFLYPTALFNDMGITPGETTETGGHSGSVKAVYNGEVDFATSYFSAPLLPEGRWSTDMSPDIPDELVGECAQNEKEQTWCGDYRVLDARTTIFGEAPDVIEKVRILGLSKEIPNDTLSFSPDFPEDLRDSIVAAVTNYIGSEACDETICHEQFYDWTGVSPIFDENFDGIRILMEAQGITLENIGE